MNTMSGRLSVGYQVAGRYQVARLLGVGEMGEVYDVRDVTTGYAYSLKLFFPPVAQSADAWTAFQREAESAARIEAEALVKAYDFQVEPQLQCPYVLGEYVTLPTLEQLVSSSGPLSGQQVSSLLRSLAPGLDGAHQAGLVHRALKPSNLFVQQADTGVSGRITDFGIGAARLFAPPPPGWTATPGWLPPEQADPSTPVSPAMDRYTLALIAFYALTGRPLFLGCQSYPPDLNLLWAEMTAPPPSASQRARELGSSLTPSLDGWFSQALALGPDQRFPSVGHMAEAFSAVFAAPRAPGPVPQTPGSPFQTFDPAPAPANPFATSAPVASALTFGDPLSTSQSLDPNSATYISDDAPNRKLFIAAGLAGALVVILGAGILIYLFSGNESSTPTSPSASVTAKPSAPPARSEEPPPPPEETKPPPPVDPPKDALITFSCDPSCKEITCDKKAVEDVSSGIRLTPGSHECIIKTPGFHPAREKLTVEAGKDQTVDVKLTKITGGTGPTRPPTPAKTCGTFLNPCKK